MHHKVPWALSWTLSYEIHIIGHMQIVLEKMLLLHLEDMTESHYQFENFRS